MTHGVTSDGTLTDAGSLPSFPRAHPESVLLVTLDSCRYDTAACAPLPSLGRMGPAHRARSPSYFTFASHAAMWVGATPGVPGLGQPWLDPKFRRLFRLETERIRAHPDDAFAFTGRNIINGFASLGHATLGTGAVSWFDPSTASGQWLIGDFERFFYPRAPDGLRAQLEWLSTELAQTHPRPVFCFVNVGETHVPYWHEGAPWPRHENPCRPYARDNRRDLCALRQRACLDYADRLLGPLLASFDDATVLATADHGDCWGEDGLWEHGTWHTMTMEVPLWLRVRGRVLDGRAPRRPDDEP